MELGQKREKPQANNEVIAYIDGKAIIEDDFGKLYYIEIEEEFVTLGEVAFSSDLTPISELEESMQLNILKVIQGE